MAGSEYETFVALNHKAEYMVRVENVGFGGNGSFKHQWTPDINKATVFNNRSYTQMQDVSHVIAKLPAVETRSVFLTKKQS